MISVLEIAKQAKDASRKMIFLSTATKNDILQSMADALRQNQKSIIAANQKDLDAGEKSGLTVALMDRLRLTEDRIEAMAEGLEIVKELQDPIGEVIEGFKRPNELEILSKRVPLGVVGIIYEARPNVTVDATGLCLKTSNAVILRGSSSAINSNLKIVEILNNAGIKAGLPKEALQLIEDT
jgi:glutamate-5-semialdehyde dehydrogenase